MDLEDLLLCSYSTTDLPKVHLLYEPQYVIACVGNFTEQKFLCKFTFPTGVWIMEVCWKYNIVTS
jgi:hypothetical protein